jgi:hypothetical protein
LTLKSRIATSMAIAAFALAVGLPGIALAKKDGEKHGIGKGGVPALAQRLAELEARVAALESMAADDDLDGYSEFQGDCDDASDVVFPGAPEVDNGLDDDCDGEIDEVDAPVVP